MHLFDFADMRFFISLFRVVVLVYIAVCVALYFGQDRMLLHPARSAPRLESGMQRDYRISEWAPAGEFAGYVMEPRSGAVKATVVVFHGNAGSVEERQPIGAELVHLGYRAVLVEYPGFGRRPGRLTLANSLLACRAATSAALAQWNGPLILFGESLGAGMAAQALVGANSRVTGVVLATPWDSLASIASKSLPIFPVRWLLHRPFDSISALQPFNGEVVVIGAQQDRLIPVAHARRLAAAKSGTHYLELPGTGHNDWFYSITAAQWSSIAEWLATHAGTAGAASGVAVAEVMQAR